MTAAQSKAFETVFEHVDALQHDHSRPKLKKLIDKSNDFVGTNLLVVGLLWNVRAQRRQAGRQRLAHMWAGQ